MCIVIVTTAHPDYPLILLNNRDEYIHRPTAPAEWWDKPYEHVLGGRDLYRSERGTWLGITKQGRIACLTNFREEGQDLIEGRRSRGAIVNAFLKTPPDSDESTQDAAQKLIREGVDGVGGFSLMFGRLQDLKPRDEAEPNLSGDPTSCPERRGLAIVSNRSTDLQSVSWLCTSAGETRALSNSHYGDRSWPKVVDAEHAVSTAVAASVSADEQRPELIARLLAVLATDTLPRQRRGVGWEVYLRELRHSVFIPAIGDRALAESKDADQVAAAPANGNGAPNGSATLATDATSGVYGTQKQTVILVDRKGCVTFFERTLFDGEGRAVKTGDGDRMFEFQVERW